MFELPVSNRQSTHTASLRPLRRFASMIDIAARQGGTWIRHMLALASLAVVVGLTSCDGDLIDDTSPALDFSPTTPADDGDLIDDTSPALDFSPTTPADADAVRIELATTDLGVGPNRLAFALIDADSGPIRGADALVSTFFLGGGQREGPIQTARAVWRRWPIAQSGLYTANFDFPRPGLWGIAASFVDSLGATRTASARFEAPPKSATPSIGEPSPRSITKLARDYDDIRRITSDPEPDPELYALTVADAIDAHKPFVVTFSTPAFCRSGTCGPQLDVVKDLKNTYWREANFIHVEVYDNPIETHPDFSNARIVRAMTEWGLPTEPWTFVIDSEGKVAAKFEAFATKDELDEALRAVLP